VGDLVEEQRALVQGGVLEGGKRTCASRKNKIALHQDRDAME
jgi:hypothetical protein